MHGVEEGEIAESSQSKSQENDKKLPKPVVRTNPVENNKDTNKPPRLPPDNRPPRGPPPREYSDRSNPPVHNYPSNSWKDSSRASVASGSLPPRMPRSTSRDDFPPSDRYNNYGHHSSSIYDPPGSGSSWGMAPLVDGRSSSYDHHHYSSSIPPLPSGEYRGGGGSGGSSSLPRGGGSSGSYYDHPSVNSSYPPPPLPPSNSSYHSGSTSSHHHSSHHQPPPPPLSFGPPHWSGGSGGGGGHHSSYRSASLDYYSSYDRGLPPSSSADYIPLPPSLSVGGSGGGGSGGGSRPLGGKIHSGGHHGGHGSGMLPMKRSLSSDDTTYYGSGGGTAPPPTPTNTSSTPGSGSHNKKYIKSFHNPPTPGGSGSSTNLSDNLGPPLPSPGVSSSTTGGGTYKVERMYSDPTSNASSTKFHFHPGSSTVGNTAGSGNSALPIAPDLSIPNAKPTSTTATTNTAASNVTTPSATNTEGDKSKVSSTTTGSTAVSSSATTTSSTTPNTTHSVSSSVSNSATKSRPPLIKTSSTGSTTASSAAISSKHHSTSTKPASTPSAEAPVVFTLPNTKFDDSFSSTTPAIPTSFFPVTPSAVIGNPTNSLQAAIASLPTVTTTSATSAPSATASTIGTEEANNRRPRAAWGRGLMRQESNASVATSASVSSTAEAAASSNPFESTSTAISQLPVPAVTLDPHSGGGNIPVNTAGEINVSEKKIIKKKKAIVEDDEDEVPPPPPTTAPPSIQSPTVTAASAKQKKVGTSVTGTPTTTTTNPIAKRKKIILSSSSSEDEASHVSHDTTSKATASQRGDDEEDEMDDEDSMTPLSNKEKLASGTPKSASKSAKQRDPNKMQKKRARLSSELSVKEEAADQNKTKTTVSVKEEQINRLETIDEHAKAEEGEIEMEEEFELSTAKKDIVKIKEEKDGKRTADDEMIAAGNNSDEDEKADDTSIKSKPVKKSSSLASMKSVDEVSMKKEVAEEGNDEDEDDGEGEDEDDDEGNSSDAAVVTSSPRKRARLDPSMPSTPNASNSSQRGGPGSNINAGRGVAKKGRWANYNKLTHSFEEPTEDGESVTGNSGAVSSVRAGGSGRGNGAPTATAAASAAARNARGGRGATVAGGRWANRNPNSSTVPATPGTDPQPMVSDEEAENNNAAATLASRSSARRSAKQPSNPTAPPTTNSAPTAPSTVHGMPTANSLVMYTSSNTTMTSAQATEKVLFFHRCSQLGNIFSSSLDIQKAFTTMSFMIEILKTHWSDPTTAATFPEIHTNHYHGHHGKHTQAIYPYNNTIADLQKGILALQSQFQEVKDINSAGKLMIPKCSEIQYVLDIIDSTCAMYNTLLKTCREKQYMTEVKLKDIDNNGNGMIPPPPPITSTTSPVASLVPHKTISPPAASNSSTTAGSNQTPESGKGIGKKGKMGWYSKASAGSNSSSTTPSTGNGSKIKDGWMIVDEKKMGIALSEISYHNHLRIVEAHLYTTMINQAQTLVEANPFPPSLLSKLAESGNPPAAPTTAQKSVTGSRSATPSLATATSSRATSPSLETLKIPMVSNTVEDFIALVPATTTVINDATPSAVKLSTPKFTQHAQQHAKNRSVILSHVRKQKLQLRHTWEEMSDAYLAQEHCWSAHVTAIEAEEEEKALKEGVKLRGAAPSSSSMRADFGSSGDILGGSRSQMMGGGSGNNNSARSSVGIMGMGSVRQSSRHMSSGGNTTAEAATATASSSIPFSHMGSVVRSDYEQEKLLNEMLAKEMKEKRIVTGRCDVPNMITPWLHPDSHHITKLSKWSKKIRPISVKEEKEKDKRDKREKEKNLIEEKLAPPAAPVSSVPSSSGAMQPPSLSLPVPSEIPPPPPSSGSFTPVCTPMTMERKRLKFHKLSNSAGNSTPGRMTDGLSTPVAPSSSGSFNVPPPTNTSAVATTTSEGIALNEVAKPASTGIVVKEEVRQPKYPPSGYLPPAINLPLPVIDLTSHRNTLDGYPQLCSSYALTTPCPLNCNCLLQVERLSSFNASQLWTDVEKMIFIDKFLQYPKNFFKIAKFLVNKTTKDCIAFYYHNKYHYEFKLLLKEYDTRRKQCMKANSVDRHLHLANLVNAVGNAGNSHYGLSFSAQAGAGANVPTTGGMNHNWYYTIKAAHYLYSGIYPPLKDTLTHTFESFRDQKEFLITTPVSDMTYMSFTNTRTVTNKTFPLPISRVYHKSTFERDEMAYRTHIAFTNQYGHNQNKPPLHSQYSLTSLNPSKIPQINQVYPNAYTLFRFLRKKYTDFLWYYNTLYYQQHNATYHTQYLYPSKIKQALLQKRNTYKEASQVSTNTAAVGRNGRRRNNTESADDEDEAEADFDIPEEFADEFEEDDEDVEERDEAIEDLLVDFDYIQTLLLPQQNLSTLMTQSPSIASNQLRSALQNTAKNTNMILPTDPFGQKYYFGCIPKRYLELFYSTYHYAQPTLASDSSEGGASSGKRRSNGKNSNSNALSTPNHFPRAFHYPTIPFGMMNQELHPTTRHSSWGNHQSHSGASGQGHGASGGGGHAAHSHGSGHGSSQPPHQKEATRGITNPTPTPMEEKDYFIPVNTAASASLQHHPTTTNVAGVRPGSSNSTTSSNSSTSMQVVTGKSATGADHASAATSSGGDGAIGEEIAHHHTGLNALFGKGLTTSTAAAAAGGATNTPAGGTLTSSSSASSLAAMAAGGRGAGRGGAVVGTGRGRGGRGRGSAEEGATGRGRGRGRGNTMQSVVSPVTVPGGTVAPGEGAAAGAAGMVAVASGRGSGRGRGGRGGRGAGATAGTGQTGLSVALPGPGVGGGANTTSTPSSTGISPPGPGMAGTGRGGPGAANAMAGRGRGRGRQMPLAALLEAVANAAQARTALAGGQSAATNPNNPSIGGGAIPGATVGGVRGIVTGAAGVKPTAGGPGMRNPLPGGTNINPNLLVKKPTAPGGALTGAGMIGGVNRPGNPTGVKLSLANQSIGGVGKPGMTGATAIKTGATSGTGIPSAVVVSKPNPSVNAAAAAAGKTGTTPTLTANPAAGNVSVLEKPVVPATTNPIGGAKPTTDGTNSPKPTAISSSAAAPTSTTSVAPTIASLKDVTVDQLSSLLPGEELGGNSFLSSTATLGGAALQRQFTKSSSADEETVGSIHPSSSFSRQPSLDEEGMLGGNNFLSSSLGGSLGASTSLGGELGGSVGLGGTVGLGGSGKILGMQRQYTKSPENATIEHPESMG